MLIAYGVGFWSLFVCGLESVSGGKYRSSFGGEDQSARRCWDNEHSARRTRDQDWSTGRATQNNDERVIQSATLPVQVGRRMVRDSLAALGQAKAWRS